MSGLEIVEVGRGDEAQGRTMWHTVALDDAGRVVAYSQLAETLPDNPFLLQATSRVGVPSPGTRGSTTT